MMSELELLAPARNYDQGCEAVNHGADALYIGAPAFGARVGAANTIEDIEALVRYAHQYHAKVFVTMNTLLFDDELEKAAGQVHQLYNCGVDALLVQDMGLLQCDLPPIPLHASTQTHNASVERVQFLQSVGFERVVLARETSLSQMRKIRQETTVELEAFVHGALCVCYSGQCYMSEYIDSRSGISQGHHFRSGNRGSCTQPCRSSYDLYNANGKLLRRGEHLLSLRDFNASQYIGNMVDAGITSFKIEGRLKDMSYVKNVTAYYRQLLDSYLESRPQHKPASSGKCTFYFVPDIEKSFNRGYTSYYLTLDSENSNRQKIASLDTSKAMGKQVAKVVGIGQDYLELRSECQFVAGDGLCYFSNQGLKGFLVNRVQGNRIYPNKMPELTLNVSLWRNNDYAFEKQLQGRTAIRKIAVGMTVSNCKDGLMLQITDIDGYQGQAVLSCNLQLANDAEQAHQQVKRQLTKLGDTVFEATTFSDNTDAPYFIPISQLNALRRNAVGSLMEARLVDRRSVRHHVSSPLSGSELPTDINYSYNVVNRQAETFYKNHGARNIEWGPTFTRQYAEVDLMTTKYCLRYELGQCLKGKNGHPPAADYQSDLQLRNNGNCFALCFDCQKCQMRIKAIRE